MTTVRMFTQKTQYTRANIEAFEATMGHGFMSAGGLETTIETAKVLTNVLNRSGGAKILDVGCGIGGPAFFFASEYGAHVHGVDINPVGIEMAKANYYNQECKGSVKFSVLDVNSADFPEESFDIIYSRDAMLHFPNDIKLILFRKFLKWLTPGGKVCITDYCIGPKSAEKMDPDFAAYIEDRGYYLFTPEDYKKCFVNAGFHDDQVVSTGRPHWYCSICQIELDHVQLPGPGRDKFLETSTEEDIAKLIKTYNDKIQMTLRGDRSFVIIHATKTKPYNDLRQAIVEAYKKLSVDGYIMSCDGNVSARADKDTFLVTPSGVQIPDLTAEKIVLCTNDGKLCPGESFKPSSEANLHDAIYRTRPDVGGIVHSHSIFVCALACCRLPLPPSHYAVCELLQDFDFSSSSGGSTKINTDDATVKCASYHTYGTKALSHASLHALGNNKAVLLANHGAVVVGDSLEGAMYNAVRLERECEIYWRSLQMAHVGPPQPLSVTDIKNLKKVDAGYGQGKESTDDEELEKTTIEEMSASPPEATSSETSSEESYVEIKREGGTSIAGRCALVTGASSGIGKAIAYALAARGVNVCLAARRLDRIDELATELTANYQVKAVAVATDVTVFDSVTAAVQNAETEFGAPLDMLVNCAGVMHYTYMKNVKVDEWTQTIDVNCKGVTNCLAAALPSILGTGHGHIINISSDAGRVVFPGLSVYSGTKFFVEALTKGLRLECAVSHGLKVTSIQPGDCKTEISMRDSDMEAKEACAQSDKTRMYWLDPSDVSDAVIYAVTQPPHVAIQELMIEPKHAPA